MALEDVPLRLALEEADMELDDDVSEAFDNTAFWKYICE